MSANIKDLLPNEGKNLVIETSTGKYERYPVKTPIIKDGDDIKALLDELVVPYLEKGDMIYISEKSSLSVRDELSRWRISNPHGLQNSL